MRNIIKGKGNNMKVIGFVRVSTGHQKLSVSNQIAEIKDYCKKTDGLELVDILQEEAVSGDAVVRVGFDKMIQMIYKLVSKKRRKSYTFGPHSVKNI